MRCRFFSSLIAFALSSALANCADLGDPRKAGDPSRVLKSYREFAMRNDGNPLRGLALFNDEQRAACVRCHAIGGTSTKAGPDLFAIGDKFPRNELIREILEPSASIAIGYGTTVIETQIGDVYQGVLKGQTADALDLVGADGVRVRIPTKNIKDQRGSNISLMPDGLQNALSLEEFADLVAFLTTLKQPESSAASNRGMPSAIPEISSPVEIAPFLTEPIRATSDGIPKPGNIRSGLVWFGQIPGISNGYVAAHQTGRIWRIDKTVQPEKKSIFLDIGSEIFNERGPNGLLSVAFHPNFRSNRRYFLKHQVFEDGKIATVVIEREATPTYLQDSGKPSRRIWKVESATQDHSGGCIAFGPDGFLYIAMGDTGPQKDPNGHGQNPLTHLGKLLRIDIDHASAPLAYSIPSDNPFRGRSDVCPEIWASGFREPWRFSFDPVTQDLWVGDVGQDRIEEVAIVRKGENHGWNVFEGFEPFSNAHRREAAAYVQPVFAYRRKHGNSVTGGHVFRGDHGSSFYGVYICGDFTSRRLFGLRQKDRRLEVVRQIGVMPQSLASFGVDEHGDLFAVGYEGMVYRFDFSKSNFDQELPAKPAVQNAATAK